MKRGIGKSSAVNVLWLSDENDSRPDRLRSTAPRIWTRRSSPAAMAASRSLGHVGDLLGNDGMCKIGSRSSHDGDVGEWNVALFFNGRLGLSGGGGGGAAPWLDEG